MAPKRFITAHAAHRDWAMALERALAMAAERRSLPDTVSRPNLGVVYLAEEHAPHAAALLAALRARTGVAHWVGAVGAGVIGDDREYLGEPGLALMLMQLTARDFRVFSGRAPLGHWAGADRALVHGDAREDAIDELVDEMSSRTASGEVVGGLASPAAEGLQIADGVYSGGLSGVAFSARVSMVSGYSRGVAPLGPPRAVTRCERNVVYALDGQPALTAMLDDLGETRRDWERLAPRLRATLATLDGAEAGGADAMMHRLLGIDPRGEGVALAGDVRPGRLLRFFRSDADAARRDLVRLCTELRDELEQRRAARVAASGPGAAGALPPRHGLPARGAIYIACSGRGGDYFGGASAEAALLRARLGEVPLVGLYAAGEIAGGVLRRQGAVLTLFGADPAA